MRVAPAGQDMGMSEAGAAQKHADAVRTPAILRAPGWQAIRQRYQGRPRSQDRRFALRFDPNVSLLCATASPRSERVLRQRITR
jgi:hypothetical protein